MDLCQQSDVSGFNKLSRFIIAFLKKIKHHLISWLHPPSAVIFEPKKIKSVTVSIVALSVCHEVIGADAVVLVFWMLSFKPAFSLFSFTFIKRFFRSFLLFAIKVVSSAYLRLLIFFPAVLIPSCASSSLAFHMMYSWYKLKKQGDNIQCWHTPFPISNQSNCFISSSLFCFLKPVYRFHRRQVSWLGIPISLRTLHSLLWSPQSQGLV